MRYRARWSCAFVLSVSTMGPAALAHAQMGITRSTPNTTAQITFAVPVQVQSFSPDVSQAQVFCQMGAVNNAAARGFTNIQLTGGAYNGTVSVPVTVAVATPGAQWSYRCSLTLFNQKLNQWNFDPSKPSWAQPAAGTTPQMATTGAIVVGQSGSK